MPGRPGEARDRVFGVAGESLRTGGHVLGAGSLKNEVLRSDQKVSYLDHFSLQHICGSAARRFLTHPTARGTASDARRLFVRAPIG